ncbi:hypothetical protein GCM10023066_33410 [Nocardioides kongjuensis]
MVDVPLTVLDAGTVLKLAPVRWKPAADIAVAIVVAPAAVFGAAVTAADAGAAVVATIPATPSRPASAAVAPFESFARRVTRR